MGIFDFFKKKGDDGDLAQRGAEGAAEGGGDSGAGKAGKAPAFKPDPRKAKRFFEYARTVADSRNYDYAIECYVNGLRHDPESMNHHEALREVALRRKVGGGKPAGLKDQYKHSGGKGPLEKMLNAEFLWAKDPINPALAMGVMENAVKSGLPEVAYWFGGHVLEANRAANKPSKSLYVKSRDLFAAIGAFDRAVEAARAVLAIDPRNMEALQKLKDMEAELTMMKGRYGEEGGTFRAAVADADKQRALDQEDSVAATDQAADEIIQRARAAYEDNPEDTEAMLKLVRALVRKEIKETEDEAIKLLKAAHERTGQYRFRVQVGDIRMKQYNRSLRQIRQRMAQTEDEKLRKQLQEQARHVASEQVKFELAEYKDRVKNYPTDNSLRYQLGRRQFAVGDYDAAIANFQEAQQDPKNRGWALRYLGESFARKEWLDEAIDTFHRGIEVHPYTDDRLALELRYELMKALDAKARRDDELASAQEASKIASQIAQADINYRDIREWLDKLRRLVDEVKRAASK